MIRVVFPGSFDPFTNGHLDVVARAAKMFDEVIIAVGTNTSKQYLFSTAEKMKLIQAAVADYQNVSLVEMHGLTVEFVQQLGAGVLLRGLRNERDYQYERDIATMNFRLGGIETLFMMARPENQNISSSTLKEVASFGADVSDFVPAVVAEALASRFKKEI